MFRALLHLSFHQVLVSYPNTLNVISQENVDHVMPLHLYTDAKYSEMQSLLLLLSQKILRQLEVKKQSFIISSLFFLQRPIPPHASLCHK